MVDMLQTSSTEKTVYRGNKLAKIYEAEQTLYPMKYILPMILLASIIIFFTLLKGTTLNPSIIGVEYCSFQYHSLTALLVAICFGLAKLIAKRLIKEDEQKEALSYDWTREPPMKPLIDKTLRLGVIAGLLGGFVGLGGGSILNPAWMEMGVEVSRASASANLCVIFTASISIF
jgi:uncharacterized membrane protein YfcA